MSTNQQSSSSADHENILPASSKAGGTESWVQGPWRWRRFDIAARPFVEKTRKCRCSNICETRITDNDLVLAIVDRNDLGQCDFGKMRTVVLEEHLMNGRSTLQGIYSIMTLACAQSALVDPEYFSRNRSFYVARSGLRSDIMGRLISNCHMYKRDIDLSSTKVSGSSCPGCLEDFSDEAADPLVTVSGSKHFNSGWTMHARCIPAGFLDQTHVDSDETVGSGPRHAYGTTRSRQPNIEHQANHVSTCTVSSFDAGRKPS